jgi:hypothetical protein
MTMCVEEIKGYMADVATMEADIIDQKIHELLIVALDGFSRLLLINSLQRSDHLPVRELALSTLDKYRVYFLDPINYGFETDVKLYGKYKEVMADPNPLWTSDSITAEFNTTHSSDIAALASLVHETFIARWLAKIAEMKAKETATLLDTAQRKILTETACADTAKALSQEKTLDDTQMNTIIADKLTQQNKELAAKVGRLENILNRNQPSGETPKSSRKNSQGGATPGRASSNKKTNTPKGKNRQKSPPPKRESASAAASANASSAAKSSKKKPSSQKRPTGNSKSKTVSFKSTPKRS